MKKFLILALALGLGVAKVWAIESVVSLGGKPESRYSITHSTISVAAVSVTTIPALTAFNGVTPGYRKLILRDITSATSFYYRMDGSTQSIPTVGMLAKETEITTLETSGAVYLQLAIGAATRIFNLITIQK